MCYACINRTSVDFIVAHRKHKIKGEFFVKTEELFERAPVWKSIFKMCLPTVVIMLVITVYNMADMVFVGQTGIAAQVAAVSLASPFFLL